MAVTDGLADACWMICDRDRAAWEVAFVTLTPTLPTRGPVMASAAAGPPRIRATSLVPDFDPAMWDEPDGQSSR
jgi:hypothetical protein